MGRVKKEGRFTPLGGRPSGEKTQRGRAQVRLLENGEFTARLNGLELWYKVSGAGPVCLFPAPGWGPSSDLYLRTLNPLENLFTIVYLDTRGSGRSQQPPQRMDYKYGQFSADLEALRLHLGQKQVWVMGHSMGGWRCTTPSPTRTVAEG